MSARFGRKPRITASDFETRLSALADDLIAKVQAPHRAYMRAMDDLAEAAENGAAPDSVVEAIIEAANKRINTEIHATPW